MKRPAIPKKPTPGVRTTKVRGGAAERPEFNPRRAKQPMMAELYRRAEARIRKQPQSQKPITEPLKTDAGTLRLLHELQVHQVELELQNEELRKARDEMEAGLEKYSDLYDFAPIGYLTLDREGTIANANLTGASLLGTARAALIKRRFGAFVCPAERSDFSAFLQQVFESKARVECDVGLLLKGADPVNVRIRAIVSDTGQACQLAVSDITGHKQAEEKLRQSEERYRTLFNSMDQGYCIIEMIFDPHQKPVDWRFLEVNPSFEKQNGLPDATGKLISVMVPDLETSWFAIYGQVALTGKAIRFEKKTKTLGQRWFDLYAFRVGGPDSRKVAVLFSNITARKNTEQVLSEKARLLDLSHDAILVSDVQGCIRYWNHGAEELYGWSRKEAVEKISHQLLHTEYLTPLKQLTEELHRTGRWIGELVHQTRDGRRVNVLVRKTLDRGRQGHPASVLETITDITARKQAEEAEHRIEVLAASNRNLHGEIMRRQALEESLRESEAHQTRLLEESRRMQEKLRQLSR